MMRPTFGDTRPTFGHPPPSPAVRDEPYRPTVGVQLGMDGTELPAIDWDHVTDWSQRPHTVRDCWCTRLSMRLVP